MESVDSFVDTTWIRRLGALTGTGWYSHRKPGVSSKTVLGMSIPPSLSHTHLLGHGESAELDNRSHCCVISRC